MGLFSRLRGLGGRDMAVDLGTANTLVYVRGRGIVLSEPSVVAIDSRNGQVHAVGVEAKRMLGRTPGTITAIRPLKDGVIADFDVTEQMLRHFIKKVHPSRFAHPRVVVCVPSGVTGVEKRAVEEACLSAGARHAYLIEEPMAAAIGAGLPVAEPTGSMIVDVGGGTTEVAVISLGGIVVSQSIRLGGDELDEAIINHCKHEYKLAIGNQTAEEVKLEAGSASLLPEEVRTEIRGRDLVSGLPRTITLSSEEIRDALDEPVGHIVDAVKDTLDRTPRSWRVTSWTAASPWPAAARCCKDSNSACATSARCPANWQSRRSRAWRSAPASPWRSLRRSIAPARSRERAGCLAAAHQAPNLGFNVYRKQVRRRRAVLALLIIGSFALLTFTYGQDSNGLQRGVSAVFSPLQTVADRALKPARDLVNWFDETFDARGRERAAAARTGDGAGAGGRRQGGGAGE